MTWEYRVMRKEDELAIYEVYYDKDGRLKGYSASPSFPAGETLDELAANCRLYLDAINKPILEHKD